MCFSTPRMPDVSPAPKKADADTVAARRRLDSAPGLYGNIFTSALGDSGYGRSARGQAATLGATRGA